MVFGGFGYTGGKKENKMGRNIEVDILGRILFFLHWWVLRAHQKRINRKTDFINVHRCRRIQGCRLGFLHHRKYDLFKLCGGLGWACSAGACILLINTAESHLGISGKTRWVSLLWDKLYSIASQIPLMRWTWKSTFQNTIHIQIYFNTRKCIVAADRCPLKLSNYSYGTWWYLGWECWYVG